MMLIEKLSERDLRMIDDWRKNYAFSSEASNTSGAFCDIKHLLREWDRSKSEYLYRLFGERFTISKHLNYSKSYEELQEEISDFTNRRYGRSGRSGYDFINAYFKLVYPGYDDPHYGFDDDVKEGLNRLTSDDCLISNKYDGAPFDLNLPDGHVMRILSGCKVSKMLGKIANAFDIPGYEDFRICHSQVLNQKNIGGTLTLSIHPLDYMTMSDNDCDWTSCMSWRDEGGYRMGTVEMMNASAVIVAYLAADEDMRVWPHTKSRTDDDVWNNKKWRQLFVVNHDLIVSVKDYPYHNSDLTKMVVEWIRELAQENLHWNYLDPVEYCHENTKIHLDYLPDEKNDFRLDIEHGAMYNDFGCVDFHWLCMSSNLDPAAIRTPNYTTRRWLSITYGGSSECMVCGCLSPDYEDESCLAGHCCQDREHCDCCGEVIVGEPNYVDGMTLCGYCYDNRTQECAHCGSYHYEDYMTPIFIIPRLTAEEIETLKEYHETYHPYDFTTSDRNECDDYMYTRETPDIWVCSKHDDPHCFDEWIADNLIEGAKPHQRYIHWNTNWYVYYDELTPDAQDEWCWGYNGDSELFKTRFSPRRAFPSKFVEEKDSEENELPF